MDLRCPNGIKFAVLTDEYVEFKCRSTRCGAEAGVVVLHRFSLRTGDLIKTLRFREPVPGKGQGGGNHATQHDPDPVRSA